MHSINQAYAHLSKPSSTREISIERGAVGGEITSARTCTSQSHQYLLPATLLPPPQRPPSSLPLLPPGPDTFNSHFAARPLFSSYCHPVQLETYDARAQRSSPPLRLVVTTSSTTCHHLPLHPIAYETTPMNTEDRTSCPRPTATPLSPSLRIARPTPSLYPLARHRDLRNLIPGA